MMQVRVTVVFLEEQDMSEISKEEQLLEVMPKWVQEMFEKYQVQCDDMEDLSKPRQELLIMKTIGDRSF